MSYEHFEYHSYGHYFGLTSVPFSLLFWLSNTSITDLLHCYGIRVVKSKSVITTDEAVKAAEELGFPIAMKLISDTITHKTEVGAVILDLRSQVEVKNAFIQIKERLSNIGKENEMQGVIIQKMIPEGVELDLNPVKVLEQDKGYVVVDARVMVI